VDKRYNYGVINTTRWTLSDQIQFKNIFSYQVQKWLNSEDVDGTTLVLDDLRQHLEAPGIRRLVLTQRSLKYRAPSSTEN